MGFSKTASSLCGENAPKIAPNRYLGGKRTGGNSGGDTQHQGSETAVQLLASIALADAALLQNGAAFFLGDTTRGFEARSHTTQPNRPWLASCSITWANSPQHEHANCADFFTVSRESQP